MDLLQALNETATPPEDSDGWYCTRELMKLLSQSEKTVTKRLHELDDDGRLEVAMMKRRNLAGRLQPVPAYRLRESEAPG